MKIKTVTYNRIKNLGNYENERIEITVEVDETTTPEDALKQAKKWVSAQLKSSKKKKIEEDWWNK